MMVMMINVFIPRRWMKLHYSWFVVKTVHIITKVIIIPIPTLAVTENFRNAVPVKKFAKFINYIFTGKCCELFCYHHTNSCKSQLLVFLNET